MVNMQSKQNYGQFGSSLSRPDGPTVEQLLASTKEDMQENTEQLSEGKVGQVYVLYHADADGRVAGWCAWSKLRKNGIFHAKFYEVQYGQPIPLDVDALQPEDMVYVLDFSYDRQTLNKIFDRVNQLVVLDHHKTAEEELRNAPYAIFNMDKSGALLAWEYFYGGEPAPLTVTLTNDRDLWKFEYPQTRPFLSAVAYHGLRSDFELWDRLANEQGLIGKWVETGTIVEQSNRQQVKACTSAPGVVTLVNWGGFKAGLFNTTAHISDCSEQVYLNKDLNVDLSMSYQFVEHGCIVFSLRSSKESNIDVSQLAKQNGGGGHKNAAGFKLSNQAGLQLLWALYGVRI